MSFNMAPGSPGRTQNPRAISGNGLAGQRPNSSPLSPVARLLEQQRSARQPAPASSLSNVAIRLNQQRSGPDVQLVRPGVGQPNPLASHQTGQILSWEKAAAEAALKFKNEQNRVHIDQYLEEPGAIGASRMQLWNKNKNILYNRTKKPR
jgi:hypothetical protein